MRVEMDGWEERGKWVEDDVHACMHACEKGLV